MRTDRAADLGWAAFIPRTILGFIVVFSGVARFQLGFDTYAHTVGAIPYGGFLSPEALAALLTGEAVVEIILGVMVLLGLFSRFATWMVGLLILIVNAAYCIAGLKAGNLGPTAQSGMFLSLYAFPRAWLVLFLMLLPATADRYSLDQLLAPTRAIFDDQTSRAWAIFIARVLVATGWFVAGVNKVFVWGAMEHARRLFIVPYSSTWIGHPPLGGQWMLWTLGVLIPYLELVFSFTLLIGVWTRVSIVVLGLILSLVSFGHLVPAPVGFIIGLFNGLILPRAALLVVVLMFPEEADRYSLAQWLRRRRATDAPTLQATTPGALPS